MNPFEVLLEKVSPNGNVTAVVEQGEGTCYFYLKGQPDDEFGVKSCWVRNLRTAPETLDVAAMRDGTPPLLPRACCRHPKGAASLREEDLELIWSEEGDSAALYEKGDLLAVIPLWSGKSGFAGYARDCVAESTLCWPLGIADTNAQFARFERARRWWKSWDATESPWPRWQSSVCAAIESALGPYSNYYAIDGGGWPPKALVRTPSRNDVYLSTVGIALRPQPGAEFLADPGPQRRIELAVRLPGVLPDKAIKQVATYVSGQSDLPWTQHTWLGSGHTLPADIFGELSGGKFPFVLLLSEPAGFPQLNLPLIDDDPVAVLWLIPIRDRERSYAKEHGSAKLVARLVHQAGNSWHRHDRDETT